MYLGGYSTCQSKTYGSDRTKDKREEMEEYFVSIFHYAGRRIKLFEGRP